jgi:hypothetical protein
MSNVARITAIAPVPLRTVRLVAVLAILSWFGMIVHDLISLPGRASWLRTSSSRR